MGETDENRLKVINTTGFGRSGSTVLGNILGQIEGFVFVGELGNIWGHGLLENRYCGCGKGMRDCEFWRAVLEKAFANKKNIDPEAMLRLRKNATASRHIPAMLIQGWKQYLANNLKEFYENVENLYLAIQSVTNCKVIIDTTKGPSHGYSVGLMPKIDLSLVHLVRDPRAVAYSWARRKPESGQDGTKTMPQLGALKSSWRWFRRNLEASEVGRCFPEKYMTLRYEDFIANPKNAVLKILEMVKEEVDALPFVNDHEVELTSNHSIWGNPDRHKVGSVILRMDDEWHTKMKSSQRLLVTTLTWPLLHKFGYQGAPVPATAPPPPQKQKEE